MTEHAKRLSPVFIVGAMRSGTTLLRLMLNESPELSIPAESHFVASLVKRFEPEQLLGDEERLSVIEWITSHEEWRRDFVTTDDQLLSLTWTGPVTISTILDHVFRLEISRSHKPRWGDKTPAYLFFTDRILAHFPDAQVVSIVRDPRDVYLSLRRYDWVGRTTWSIGNYLRRCGDLVERWSSAFDASRFMVVRYEDLVLDTETTLRRLASTLALTYDDRMLSFFEGASDNVQEWEFEIGAHTKLRRNVEATDVARWRTEGDRRQIAEVESLNSVVIERHGYEPALAAWRLPLVRARARVHQRLAKRHETTPSPAKPEPS
jgi:hypothetical protein